MKWQLNNRSFILGWRKRYKKIPKLSPLLQVDSLKIYNFHSEKKFQVLVEWKLSQLKDGILIPCTIILKVLFQK